MKIENISKINFGEKPQLFVSNKYRGIFDEVADKFDIYTKKIKRNPDDFGYYEIEQNRRGMIFTEYKDGWEHSIKFGKKLTSEFLEKSTDYIAKTLAKAAEIFALDDKLWLKTSKFTDTITKNKQLKMSDKVKENYSEALLSEMYNKYILRTLENKLKENEFLAKAKIRI